MASNRAKRGHRSLSKGRAFKNRYHFDRWGKGISLVCTFLFIMELIPLCILLFGSFLRQKQVMLGSRAVTGSCSDGPGGVQAGGSPVHCAVSATLARKSARFPAPSPRSSRRFGHRSPTYLGRRRRCWCIRRTCLLAIVGLIPHLQVPFPSAPPPRH